MKSCLLLIGLCVGAVASAQQPMPKLPMVRSYTTPPIQLEGVGELKLMTYSHLPKSPGVYKLPGGMPCLVPDTKSLASMPNVWNGEATTGIIPNPGLQTTPQPSAPIFRNFNYRVMPLPKIETK